MKIIKTVVREFNVLCKLNKFKEAGELAKSNRQNFIKMINDGSIQIVGFSDLKELKNTLQTFK